ncbi:CLUMA_CG000480, isoform A [Clunio marinus]|uniref:CLUMA_CG000480, isoform A n=1 Tax=Clunio marinus TaxID=568069 RepID=A0A1J1HGV5_9DIPT|nr:CLUMA_CG000480, isoform A [Clunio marinus]
MSTEDDNLTGVCAFCRFIFLMHNTSTNVSSTQMETIRAGNELSWLGLFLTVDVGVDRSLQRAQRN